MNNRKKRNCYKAGKVNSMTNWNGKKEKRSLSLAGGGSKRGGGS